MSQHFQDIIIEPDCKHMVDNMVQGKFQNNEFGEVLRQCHEKRRLIQNCSI